MGKVGAGVEQAEVGVEQIEHQEHLDKHTSLPGGERIILAGATSQVELSVVRLPTVETSSLQYSGAVQQGSFVEEKFHKADKTWTITFSAETTPPLHVLLAVPEGKTVTFDRTKFQNVWETGWDTLR